MWASPAAPSSFIACFPLRTRVSSHGGLGADTVLHELRPILSSQSAMFRALDRPHGGEQLCEYGPMQLFETERFPATENARALGLMIPCVMVRVSARVFGEQTVTQPVFSAEEFTTAGVARSCRANLCMEANACLVSSAQALLHQTRPALSEKGR